MNEETSTGVSSEKENIKESQSQSVTPSLDTPSGVGLGASHRRSLTAHTLDSFHSEPYLGALGSPLSVSTFSLCTDS